jgi:hypothetical protein
VQSPKGVKGKDEDEHAERIKGKHGEIALKIFFVFKIYENNSIFSLVILHIENVHPILEGFREEKIFLETAMSFLFHSPCSLQSPPASTIPYFFLQTSPSTIYLKKISIFGKQSF